MIGTPPWVFRSLSQLPPCPRIVRAIVQDTLEAVVKKELSLATPQREAEAGSLGVLPQTAEAEAAP